MHICVSFSILESPSRFPGVIKCFRSMRFYNRNTAQNIRNNQPILCLKLKKNVFIIYQEVNLHDIVKITTDIMYKVYNNIKMQYIHTLYLTRAY